MTTRRYDVVFLDAGGVLVSPNSQMVAARFAAVGYGIDPDALFEAHYRGMHAVDEAQAAPEVFDDYHAAYTRHLGLDPAVAADAVGALEGLWAEGGLWTQPLPWATAGLAAIASTGIPIVVVSNADGTVADLLAQAGLLQVGAGPGIEVAGIIDSGSVGVAKPDPRIFEMALDLVGVSADRAIHVGDAYQYDVRGARAAGVHPVLVDPLGLRPDVDCDRVGTLLEVAPLLG